MHRSICLTRLVQIWHLKIHNRLITSGINSALTGIIYRQPISAVERKYVRKNTDKYKFSKIWNKEDIPWKSVTWYPINLRNSRYVLCGNCCLSFTVAELTSMEKGMKGIFLLGGDYITHTPHASYVWLVVSDLISHILGRAFIITTDKIVEAISFCMLILFRHYRTSTSHRKLHLKLNKEQQCAGKQSALKATAVNTFVNHQ